jgi:hypothetical protein
MSTRCQQQLLPGSTCSEHICNQCQDMCQWMYQWCMQVLGPVQVTMGSVTADASARGTALLLVTVDANARAGDTAFAASHSQPLTSSLLCLHICVPRQQQVQHSTAQHSRQGSRQGSRHSRQGSE